MSILFELERMERLIEDLEKLCITGKEPISDYWRIEGKEEGGAVCPLDGWEKCRIEENWNTLNAHRWYRTRVTIPASMDQKHVEFLITTGREGEWDATNPQMLFYLNGRLIQGVDVNHRLMMITDQAKAGEEYEIAILAYSGTVPGDLIIHTDLVAVDQPTQKVYYDMLVPVKAARLLKKPDVDNYRRIVVKLGAAADALDLRDPYSESYYAAIAAAEEILIREFYTKVDENAPVVSAIGHTHIDIAWLWTVSQTREKAVRSFSTVLELMRRYPDYHFMSSQPILYQFVKEQEPELYQEIKERIKEGRWEADGAMWLESDCNLPAGESLVRQVIKGERFFQEEFGVSSKTLWLPDVFGYSAAVPQILKKCGIPYFLTTKISWNQFNQLPNDTFIWRGMDGSDVFVFMPTACDFDKTLGLNISFTDTRNTTTYTGIVNPNMTLGSFKRFQNRDLSENTLMLFGFGDGGGGPTTEMLEEADRLKYGLPGIPRLVQEPEMTFMDRLHDEIADKPDMPVWDGELYFEYHRGTLTSMGKNKRNNRKSELLYEQLETLAVMGQDAGVRYPEETIRSGWDTILLNQFHDIIPGSAIEAVYDQSDLEYAKIQADGKAAQKEILEQMTAKIMGSVNDDSSIETIAVDPAKPVSVLVWNTQGFERNSIVKLTREEWKAAGTSNEMEQTWHSIISADGIASPVQYDDAGNLYFSAKNLPSLGYAGYELSCKNVESEDTADVEEWNGSFENPWYRVQFNENLQITSLIEKETGFELLADGRIGNHLVSYEDRPMNWDNWDVDYFYQRKPYEADEISPFVIKENGPVRLVLANKLRFSRSTVEQEIILYPDLPRIDFHTTADWQNHNVLLRVNFPTQLNAARAAYEIQYGNVERETTHNQSWDSAKFEVCAHKWADLSEEGLGLSILNDCKYGHSIKDGVLGLTLIKAGTYPNPNADMGHHEFTYSIYPHAGRWKDARTVEMAYDLNVPVLISTVAGKISAKASQSMLRIQTSSGKDHVFFELLKQSEDGKDIILRLYENQDIRGRFTLQLDGSLAKVKAICECDLMERPLGETVSYEGRFTDTIRPYEIKTYRLSMK